MNKTSSLSSFSLKLTNGSSFKSAYFLAYFCYKMLFFKFA